MGFRGLTQLPARQSHQARRVDRSSVCFRGNRLCITGVLSLALLMVATADHRKVSASEYVWARSQFVMGPNRPVSAMGNGYGGYYVPRNAYGNNYEGQRIRNPNGYIVPANSPPVARQPLFRGRRFR